MIEPIQIKVSDTIILYGLPARGTDGAAGYDLRADIQEPISVAPGTTTMVPTGISVFIKDRNVAAYVFPRSGLAYKHSVTLQNAVGLIDSDYQGEIKVLLRNEGTEPFEVNPGDRIAQMVFAPVYHPMMAVVQEFVTTTRGTGGFGSTGVASRTLAEGEAPDSAPGKHIPAQLLGNDEPLTPGEEFEVVQRYEPTGFELLEAAYGE